MIPVQAYVQVFIGLVSIFDPLPKFRLTELEFISKLGTDCLLLCFQLSLQIELEIPLLFVKRLLRLPQGELCFAELFQSLVFFRELSLELIERLLRFFPGFKYSFLSLLHQLPCDFVAICLRFLELLAEFT